MYADNEITNEDAVLGVSFDQYKNERGWNSTRTQEFLSGSSEVWWKLFQSTSLHQAC